MAQGLRERGVINPIEVEETSQTTVDNARLVASKTGAHQAVLVTSTEHMERAQQAFRDQGIVTIPVDAFGIQ